MKKVMIIGSSGAGKSTFSRRLSEKTGLPLIHLDVLFWKPNWVETDKEEWKKILEKAVAGDSWIMDGHFGGTIGMRLEKCDTVIFLDMPRALCVYRILKRVVTYQKGKRPDMADGCDEKFDWQFLKWVWNFPERSKPKIEKLLAEHQNSITLFRLKSTKEVERFLSEL
ncbi:MAG TPA: DNA topology modulation protein [Pyrinomonadaceae bacterium]|nr:DNA topology modulation protein [Pyrinomonadaceae bacterium]